MRWWLRILVTLVLAPVVWQLVAIYLGSAQGGTADALFTAALAALPKLYLVYTLPALALVVVVLVPADRLLARLGVDLLIVAVAPALALLVAIVVQHLSSAPQVEGAGVVGLAFVYGLVYGLSVREPNAPVSAARETAPA